MACLGEVSERGRRRVRGEVRGVGVEVALLWGPAWRVRAEVASVPVALDVVGRAHARSVVEIGDPRFESAYAVDGAPAGVVRKLLTPDVRERISALDCERIRLADGALDIVKRHHFQFDERREIALALALAVDLALCAERVAREEEAELFRQAPQAGEPYRGGPDRGAVAALTTARDAEIRAAKRRSRGRWNKGRAAAGLLFGGWFVFELVVQIL